MNQQSNLVSSIKKIIDWNKVAGVKNTYTPAAFVKLLREEIDEYEESIVAGDHTNALKELTDVLVIMIGGLYNLEALDEDLNGSIVKACELVMRSNFTKFCDTEEQAQQSALDYAKVKKIDISYKPVKDLDGVERYVIFDRQSRKIKKPTTYTPVDPDDLRELLKEK